MARNISLKTLGNAKQISFVKDRKEQNCQHFSFEIQIIIKSSNIAVFIVDEELCVNLLTKFENVKGFPLVLIFFYLRLLIERLNLNLNPSHFGVLKG